MRDAAQAIGQLLGETPGEGGDPRLEQGVGGAPAQRGERRGGAVRAGGGDHQHARALAMLDQLGKRGETVDLGHFEIEQDDIDAGAGEDG